MYDALPLLPVSPNSPQGGTGGGIDGPEMSFTLMLAHVVCDGVCPAFAHGMLLDKANVRGSSHNVFEILAEVGYVADFDKQVFSNLLFGEGAVVGGEGVVHVIVVFALVLVTSGCVIVTTLYSSRILGDALLGIAAPIPTAVGVIVGVVAAPIPTAVGVVIGISEYIHKIGEFIIALAGGRPRMWVYALLYTDGAAIVQVDVFTWPSGP